MVINEEGNGKKEEEEVGGRRMRRQVGRSRTQIAANVPPPKSVLLRSDSHRS